MRAKRILRKPYAGFNPRELTTLFSLVGEGDTAIADPMCGASGALCALAGSGRRISLSDSNPVAVLLTSLRHPFLKQNELEIMRLLPASVREASCGLLATGRAQFVAEVLTGEVEEMVAEYGNRIEGTPIVSEFGDAGRALMQGIAILSASEIANVRGTKNETWPRLGNVASEIDLSIEFMETARAFLSWLEAQDQRGQVEWNDLTISVADVREATSSHAGLDLIVTSPPYANRVDYPRYWAPELALWDSLNGTDVAGALRLSAIGPSHIRSIGIAGPQRFGHLYEHQIAAIQDRSGYESPHHYAQLARVYSERLAVAVEEMILSLNPAGRLALALRNTKFGDYVFNPGEIIRGVAEASGRSVRIVDENIVRNHVGNRARARSKSTVVGLAQSAYVLVVEAAEGHL